MVQEGHSNNLLPYGGLLAHYSKLLNKMIKIGIGEMKVLIQQEKSLVAAVLLLTLSKLDHKATKNLIREQEIVVVKMKMWVFLHFIQLKNRDPHQLPIKAVTIPPPNQYISILSILNNTNSSITLLPIHNNKPFKIRLMQQFPLLLLPQQLLDHKSKNLIAYVRARDPQSSPLMVKIEKNFAKRVRCQLCKDLLSVTQCLSPAIHWGQQQWSLWM